MNINALFGRRCLVWTIFIVSLVHFSPFAYAEEPKQSSAAQQTSIASRLVFGSGEECPHEPYCLPALEDKYGLHFAQFKVTDPGGARTRQALEQGEIQIGVLFTTNGYLATDRFVLLEDDRHAQPAENIIPIAHNSIAATYPQIGTVLDAISAALTTKGLAEMNRRFDLDKVAVDKIAHEWLSDQAFFSQSNSVPRIGPTIVVGSANFAESAILAEIYAQALIHAGYSAQHQKAVGNRATYLPLLEKGEIGLFLEYTGSLRGWLNTLAKTSRQPLPPLLKSRGLVAFNPAPAEDKNGIVVTADTARRYGLVNISDLAKPAP